MAALDREFKAKWTKEYFEEVRSAWNSIVAEKSNGGKIALTRKDLESVERRVGEKSQDIAKARTMLGIAPPTPQDAKKVMENAKPKIEVRNYNGTNQLLVNGEIEHVFFNRSIEEELAKLDKDNVTLYSKKAEENRRIRGMLKELAQQATNAGGASGEAIQPKKDPKDKFFDQDFKHKTGGYENLSKAYEIEGKPRYWKGGTQEEADAKFMKKWGIDSLEEIASFDERLKSSKTQTVLDIVSALGGKESFVEKAKGYASFFRKPDEYLMRMASGEIIPSERENSDLKTMAFEVGL